VCQFSTARAAVWYRSTVLKGHERSPILLTQAEHKSQVAQSQPAQPRKSDDGLRVGARDLRSRIDLEFEIEDINQRSAALVRGWPLLTQIAMALSPVLRLPVLREVKSSEVESP